jgi:hypothetical protein
MAISPEDLYLRLGQLVESMPEFEGRGPLPSEVYEWLGRAQPLIGLTEIASADAIIFTSAANNLGDVSLRPSYAGIIKATIYRALARAELNAPASTRGAFLPIDRPLDAFAAVGKVLSSAKTYVRIVDRYLDENAFTEFAVLAAEEVEVQLLAGRGEKPGVKPAAARFIQQFGVKRPLAVRLSPPLLLHDRLIDVDGAEAWILTQSLNALATRSPATLSKAPPEISAPKIAAYTELWNNAEPV